MVEAIKEDFKYVFFDLIKSTRNSIKLCSPFVKKSIIDQIFEIPGKIQFKLLINVVFLYLSSYMFLEKVNSS